MRENRKYVAAEGGLRLRQEPNSESKVMMLIPNGTQVNIVDTGMEATINGRTGRWVKVDAPLASETGWVFDGFLSTNSPVSPFYLKDMSCLPGTKSGPAGVCESAVQPPRLTIDDGDKLCPRGIISAETFIGYRGLYWVYSEKDRQYRVIKVENELTEFTGTGSSQVFGIICRE